MTFSYSSTECEKQRVLRVSLLIRERKGQVVTLNALSEDFSCQTLQPIGLSPVHDSIFIEDKNVLYVNIRSRDT